MINDAGCHSPATPEWLAERTHTDLVVMMLVLGGMRVALATTICHCARCPMRSPVQPDPCLAYPVYRLQRVRPGAAAHLVAGLNPHAGEGGHMGRGKSTIEPVLRHLRDCGPNLIGPLPAVIAAVQPAQLQR